MINLILCGGNGTRLWPISRTLLPKQFVKLFDDRSLFQETVNRNSNLCKSNFIVSNVEQYFLAYDQLEDLKIKNSKFLLEPVGRNTAPAIALACFELDPNEIALVTPSDHVIKNQKNYEEVLKKAKKLAEQDNLVTFGITPNAPEIGFGYIESDKVNSETREGSLGYGENVEAFHEKPNLETAKSYLKN